MAKTTPAKRYDNATTFRIGTVSRMTDIPVDTLRAWERRYGVVKPERSDGSDRLYNQDDIYRLSLLKKLIDRGHSIGSIANLSNESLSNRLELHESNLIVHKSIGPLKISVLGDVLPLRIENSDQLDKGIKYVGLHRNAAEFESSVQKERPDILLLEYAAIYRDTLEEIRRFHREAEARHTFILYGFADKSVMESLDANHFTALQAPISLVDLQLAIKRLLANRMQVEEVRSEELFTGPAPDRLFDNRALVEASMVTGIIKCECPQHLSGIIQKLVQFEIYSTECESRNEEDARLHAYIMNATGHARALMEQALAHVIKAEGLDIRTSREGEGDTETRPARIKNAT